MVLAYVVLRKMLIIASSSKKYEAERKLLEDHFERSFGLLKVSHIYQQRILATAFKWAGEGALKSFATEHMNKKLLGIICLIYEWMSALYWQKELEYCSSRDEWRALIRDPRGERQQSVKEPEFTHDALIALFEQLLKE